MANNLSNEEIEKRRKRAEEARRKSLEKRNAGSPIKSIDTTYYTADQRKYAEEMQNKVKEKTVKALPILQAKQTGAAGNFASIAGLPILEKAQANPASTKIPALDSAVTNGSASNGVLIPEGATTEQITQVLDVWNADGYKMNAAEEKSFKAFKDSYMAKGTPQHDAYRQENSVPMAEAYLSGADLDLYNKFLETDKKSSELYSFAGNLLNAMPFSEAILKGGDQLSEKLFGINAGAGEHLDSVEKSSQQNPLAAIAGTLAGQIGGYGAVKDAISAIPVLGKAVSAISDKISKIPGLGKYGQNISNILADTSIDTIAETLPQAIENMQSGKNAGQVASEALKSTAANVGFNVLGEAATAGLPVLTDYLKGKGKGVSTSNTVETFSKPLTGDLTEQIGKTTVDAENAAKKVEDLGRAIPEVKQIDGTDNISKNISDPAEKALSDPNVTNTHTPEQIIQMQEYVAATDQRIVDFANEVRSAENGKYIKPLEMSKVSDRAAADIKKLTGIDVAGNKIVLDKSAIEHIDKRHGVNGNADHSMADDKTLSRLQYVLNNYDHVELGDGTKSLKLANQEPAPTVVFSKKVDGNYYIVEAVTDAKKKTNRITSAYVSSIDPSATKKEAYLMPDAIIPRRTSEIESEFTSSENIIPKIRENVNDGTKVIKTTIPSRKLRSTVTSASEAVDHIQKLYKGNEVLAKELKKSFTDLLDNPTDENWEKMIKAVQQYEGTIKGKTAKTRYGDTQKYSNEVRDVLNMFDNNFATELDAATYPKEVVEQIEQMYSGPAKYRVDYQSGSTKKNFKRTFDTLEDAQNFMDKTPDATFSVKDTNGEYVLADAEKMAAEKEKNLMDLNLQFFGNKPAIESVAENVDNGAKSISQNVDTAGNEPKIPVGMKERGYAESIRTKTDLPEEVKNEFVREPEIYEQLSNATTKARAEEIMARGTKSATTEFRRMLESKDPAAVPLGRFIADDLITQGRSEEAVQVLRDMSKALTESGQFSQAAAITLMKSDPTTALQYVQRSLDDVNNAGKKKFGNKWKDIQLTDEQIKQFSECAPGDSEGIKKAMQNVGNYVAKQYPATKWEQFVELTKVGMLLNPRTNMRNVVSNAMMRPVRSLTDRVSALGQNAYTLIDPDYKPTQSILPANKQQKKLATEAFETVRDSILGDSSRWNNVKSGVQDKQVFKGSAFSKLFDNITGGALTKLNQAMGKDISPSVLETARNLTYWLLEKGDDVFVKKNFEDRMSSYIRAQGIQNLEDIPEDAFTVAIEEAMKATFKDDTALSRALSGVKKNLGPLGEVIMPFTKTPANLAMRGYDYSPASIITAAKNIKDQAGATKFFDDLSKTAVGTAGVFLGYQLTKHGILEGALSEDKDQAAFQKQQGKLPFSVNINGNYYTYDFAQPASIPLILGATIYDSMKDSDNAAETIKQGAVAAVDSWMGLSPLQSLSDIFGGYGTPAENLFNEVAEFPQRVIPAALGATARVVDPVQRQTFSNEDILQTQIDTAISKIPVLSKTLPASYDTWGNEIRRADSVGEGIFAQYLSPGQLGNESTTQIDGEIERLFEATGNNAVFPKKASWSVNSQKLTNREYSDYQRQMGTVSYDMALQLIGATNYDTLPDDTKADLLADMYSLSDTMAKHELFGTGLGNKEKLAGVYEDYGAEGVVNYLLAKKLADLDGNGSLKKNEVTLYLDTQDMTNSMKEYYFSILSSAKNNPYSN